MAQGVGDKRKRSRVGSGERPQWAVDGSEGAIPTGARRCHRALASEEQRNKWGTMDEDDLQALKGKELEEICGQLGLKKGGIKAEKIKRIVQFFREE